MKNREKQEKEKERDVEPVHFHMQCKSIEKDIYKTNVIVLRARSRVQSEREIHMNRYTRVGV